MTHDQIERLARADAQTAWADLPALSPVRRIEPGAVLSDSECEAAFADSQAAALVPAALAHQQHQRVEPWAVLAAITILSIVLPMVVHLLARAAS